MKNPFYHEAILKTCTLEHLTADEIFEAVRKEFPKAWFSTIYRNVEELTEKGELRKISGIGSKALFERRIDGHVAHFVDKETGRVYDLPFPKSLVLAHVPKGFAAENVDIRIYGAVRA